MTSILTNSGAISAVDKLRSIGSARLATQQQLNTGLRVDTAQDNTAYWSIATTMRSDNRALSAAEDSLGLGAAAVDVAYTGMTNAIYVVQQIKDKLISGREGGVNRVKINTEIKELREELYTIVDASSFNGENWLLRHSTADDADKELVGSFVRDGKGNVSIKTLNYSMANALGTNHLIDDDSQSGILTNVAYAQALGTTTDWVLLNGRNQTLHTEFTLSNNTAASDVDDMISVTERMLMAMTDAAAGLGSTMSRIKMQGAFVADLQDTQDRGVGRLVDANLESAASKMRAIDVQRSLANQALSVANATPLNLLPLLK
ncbi:MAG: flaA [Rhizobium sp.]|nr:flaA [Rhizobium sp.]